MARAAGPADGPRETFSARVGALRACTPAERAEAIEQLGALLCATQAELCDVVTAADAEGDWKVDGATAMAPWLVGTLHVASGTARAWVRVGAALDRLPHLRAAFAEGLLSWDQVRPATTFVTPGDDGEQAQHLQGCSAAQVEDLARQHRPRTTRDARRAHDLRRLHARTDHATGGRRYSGFLPAELAARFEASLDRVLEEIGPNEDGLFDPIFVRRADALVELADKWAAGDVDPDTCLAVVHVPADVVDGHVDGNGTVDDLQVAADSVLRLLCDCKLEFHIDNPDGATVGISRGSRSIPRWLRRRIRKRDGGTCRFWGCDRQIRQIHHVQHWSRGGPTDGCNLCGLCWYHHHLVHEGGWTIQGNADHELTFVSPFGREVTSRPQPLAPHTRRRAAHAAGVHLHPDDQPPKPAPAPPPEAQDQPLVVR
jgi:hypothetical protein